MNRFCVIVLLVVLFCGNVSGQRRQISGQVVDSDNLPLWGATVQIKGTQMGAMVDSVGNFRLSVDSSNAILIFRYIGLVTEEVVVGNDSIINVTLYGYPTGGLTLNAFVQNRQLLRVEKSWEGKMSGDFIQHIFDNIVYPEAAILQGIQGSFEVRFVVNRRGRATNIRLCRSYEGILFRDRICSGIHPLLDREILSAMRRAPRLSEDEIDILMFLRYYSHVHHDNLRRFWLPIHFIITEIEQEKL